MSFPALVCKNLNCSRPMLLPEPKPLDTSQRQPWWPTDEQPRNFLCPACRHAFEYSAQDVRHLQFDERVRDPSQIHGSVVLIETGCVESGCVAQLQLRTLMASSVDIHQEAMRVLSRWTADGVRCSAGHPLQRDFRWLANHVVKMQATLDPDWESIDA